MEVLRNPDSTILSLLPGNDSFSGFILSTYVIKEELQDCSILYNTLTGEVIRLEHGEWPEEELADHHFTVPPDLDEHALCGSIRGALAFHRDAHFEGYRQFTVLTTTDCNARCFYCYQRGCEHISMTDEDAERTAGFILRNRAPRKLHVRWFGGEPLYNSRAIDIISRKLRDAGAEFTSDIITNGYLFDEQTARKAVSEWHLTEAQAALDGTRSVYNKRKAFIYDDPDAFETVMRSLENMLNAGIKVRVRLNADNVNVSDLKELCVYLDERFRSHPDLMIYSHPLFSIKLGNKDEKAISERAKLYASLKELNDLIESLGRASAKVPGGLRVFSCMADSPESIVLLPDGKTHSCEQFNANHYLGTIDGAEPKSSDLPYWRALHPEHKDCAGCVLYPQCVKLLHCPDINEECLPEDRELKIQKIRSALVKNYSGK